MALFSAGPAKTKQIELQNIIFGTAEKKLMVSPEFLDEMTKHYITKRMKTVNQSMEIIATTKIVKNFFTSYENIISSLDELIIIEKYHEFKKPVPSVFKKSLEEKEERYIQALINRVWKDANQKAKYDPKTEEKRDPEKFAWVLNDFLEYRDKYSQAVFELVNNFYTSVYGYGVDEEPEPEIPDVTDEASEEGMLAEGEMPLDGEMPDDGFDMEMALPLEE